MFEKVLLKYDGELREIPVAELDMDPEQATDEQIRTAVERHLEVDSLAEYVIERGDTVLNMRPTAAFGNNQECG